nr:hypothetical protein [Chloroflexia bacterium]
MRQLTTAPTIVPPGETATVGPWRMTIAESISGADALTTLQDANDGNQEPGEDLVYLLLRVSCHNRGETPCVVSTADFAAAGADGIFRRSPSVALPDPALEATVASGEAVEGWIALVVPADNADGSDVVVRYDSVASAAVWGSALFAVRGEPVVVTDEGAAGEINPEVGASADAPAGLGETVVTGGWAVTAVESITGQEVFDRAGPGLQALGRSGGID